MLPFRPRRLRMPVNVDVLIGGTSCRCAYGQLSWRVTSAQLSPHARRLSRARRDAATSNSALSPATRTDCPEWSRLARTASRTDRRDSGVPERRVEASSLRWLTDFVSEVVVGGPARSRPRFAGSGSPRRPVEVGRRPLRSFRARWRTVQRRSLRVSSPQARPSSPPPCHRTSSAHRHLPMIDLPGTESTTRPREG